MNRRIFNLGLAVIGFAASGTRGAVAAQPAVSIAYDLGEAGWSSFVLTVHGKRYEVGAFSWITDALDDLVRLAIDVATGANRAQVSLDGEPMEWRLILDQDNEPDMRLRILTFPDASKAAPESEGHLDFEARVRADDFARAMQTAVHGLWDRYGEKGYAEKWGGDRGFPLRAMRALDAALAD